MGYGEKVGWEMKAIKTAEGLPEYCFASDYKDGIFALVSTWERMRCRACRGSVTSLISRKKVTANDERFALAA